MEEKNNNNKKKIILVLIAVLTILLVIGGATYAFYTVQVNNSSTPTNFNTNTEVVGNATLKMLTDNLHINVTAQDMAEGNKGNDYYGTKDATKSYETEQSKATYNLVEVDMKDGGSTTKYVCSAIIKVSVEGEMVSGLKAKDLILSLNGGNLEEELDIYSIKETREKSYDVKFNIEGNTTHTIKGYLKLSNRDDVQTNLANKSLNVKLNSTKIECNVVTEFPKETTLDYLRENDENNFITEDLVGGLYRYQGSNTDNVNNWICFGKDKTSCDTTVGNKYRIIGITDDGQLKLIKKAPYSDNTVSHWYLDHHKFTSFDNYKNSIIRSSFNDNSRDYLYISDETKEKIEDHTWLYGYIGNIEQENLYNGDYIYAIENGETEVTYNNGTETITKKWDETVTDKIGLLYIHDYLYTYKGGTIDDPSNVEMSWLQSNAITYEWLITYFGMSDNTNKIYYIDYYNKTINSARADNGNWSYGYYPNLCMNQCASKCGTYADPGYSSCMASCNGSCSTQFPRFTTRAVFYLKNSVKIVDGNGTENQPYIIQ